MDKKARIATIVSIIVVLVILALMVFAAPRKCKNGVDDDNDGLVDYPNDPGCNNAQDKTETSTSLVCDNGADATNDRDTLADFRLSGGDPGCTSATDTSEIDGECDDLDDETNDRDTLTDSTDPGCTSTSDTSEIDGDCDDLDDETNDADTLTDSTDPGCTSTSDTSEVDGQCDDLGDNDNDGLVDLSDAGCTSTSDSSELGTAACDNGLDEAHDWDTLADFRLSNGDAGCSSPTDNWERDDAFGGFGTCDDFTDNDNDGFNSYPADPECANYGDLEWNCNDSDGGQVYTVQGTTSGSFGGTPFSGTDSCVDSVTLTEYYCNLYNLGSQNVNCAMNQTTSCVNGACV